MKPHGDDMDDVTTETTHPSGPARATDLDAAQAHIATLAAELAETTAALVTARRELETLRVTHHELRRAHDDLKASKAYRLAACLSALRDSVRRP